MHAVITGTHWYAAITGIHWHAAITGTHWYAVITETHWHAAITGTHWHAVIIGTHWHAVITGTHWHVMKFTGTQKDECNDPVFSTDVTLTGTNHIRFKISRCLFIKHQMQLTKENKAKMVKNGVY
jgi:hypothetical protein